MAIARIAASNVIASQTANKALIAAARAAREKAQVAENGTSDIAGSSNR